MRWMNLEPIIQSEVSQKEENKYCILTHIYGIQKDGTDAPICREAVETDVWDKGKGEEGEGEMNGESGMEICTLPYVKQPIRVCCMTQGTQTRAL